MSCLLLGAAGCGSGEAATEPPRPDEVAAPAPIDPAELVRDADRRVVSETLTAAVTAADPELRRAAAARPRPDPLGGVDGPLAACPS
ncbi:MAG: hypothetical protein M5U28_51540 [Sandaracinaceae bacterium]|nr:hypothetical protein [Sandaracinaceae bacterium]